MNIASAVWLAMSCAVVGHVEPACFTPPAIANGPTVAVAAIPVRSTEALDVLVTAEAAVVWDIESGAILYSKSAATRRPVASLVKLLSTLTIRETLAPTAVVEIPDAVRQVQRVGAHIRLPVGQHATVTQLLAASLIASANDAVVALAEVAGGDEAAFVLQANEQAHRWGLHDTHVANATGLPGGEQYSTANDIKELLTRAYNDPVLAGFLDDANGSLTTSEGTQRVYESTNELLATYVPVIAAKTGYTVEAGENLALLTRLPSGHTIGIVVLGSDQRFQDTKILAEWIHRHFEWPI